MNLYYQGCRLVGWIQQVFDSCFTKTVSRWVSTGSARRILCFGDSNTWGAKPLTGVRYAFRHRWPGVLQRELGSGFIVLEEGRKGRTTVLDDPEQRGYNGKEALSRWLLRYASLDLVIILLGTNDLKDQFLKTPQQIADGMKELGRLVMVDHPTFTRAAPMLMLVSPPPIDEQGEDLNSFREGIGKSRLLADHYRHVANELHCEFFDAGSVIHSSVLDGVHWDREAHQQFGRRLAERVRMLFQEKGRVHSMLVGHHEK